MKSSVILLVFAFCSIECRKIVPIDKNANVAFINMEAGGVARPQPAPAPSKPVAPVVTPAPAPAKPVVSTPAHPKVSPPVSPVPQPKPANIPAPLPAKPSAPVQPTQPSQIKPKPVYPAPAANPITTPGPGSVKQLINFYDSQGKASPIRPYSYSQAVKQG